MDRRQAAGRRMIAVDLRRQADAERHDGTGARDVEASLRPSSVDLHDRGAAECERLAKLGKAAADKWDRLIDKGQRAAHERAYDPEAEIESPIGGPPAHAGR